MPSNRTPLASISVACAVLLFVPPLHGQVAAMRTAAREDSTRETESRVGALPVIGSAPETGLQYGATVYRLSHPVGDSATRETMTQLYAIYTTKRQFKAFLETDRWSRGNVWHVNGRLEFLRFPLPFFGIGANAPKDAEEWYTPRSITLTAQAQRRVLAHVYVGASYQIGKTSIVRYDDDGVLIDRLLTGSDGGRVGLVEGQAIFDSRDNHLSSARGSYLKLTGGLARGATGSTFDFERTTLDARHFVSLGRAVLAGQVFVAGATGDAPIDQLAQFGDVNTMRGYERGRYRDRWMLTAQAEVRQPLVGRLGGAVFAGAGTVAGAPGTLGSESWQPTLGAGLRWRMFAKGRTAIRVDYGVGRGSSGLYVALNEAY
jgi:outer membrane protein assembly factor BamA